MAATALVVIVVLAAIQIPNAIATHPIVGLGLIGFIAAAVLALVALSVRSKRRWAFCGAVALVAIAAEVVHRSSR